MFFGKEGPCPVLETDVLLSPCELQELFSLIQSPAESLSLSSGSKGSSRAVYSVDERKRRRMISNRKSARRSRWRKKRHLENLLDEVNRLKTENQEAQNRLHLVLYRSLVLHSENNRLKSESVYLDSKLSHLCWLLSSNPHGHATCPIISNQYC